MALTGKLAADFSSFVDACARSEVALTSFESRAGSVQSALNKVGDSFSGVKVIQQAQLAATALEQMGGAGGVASGILQLTESELNRIGPAAVDAAAKLTLMGQQVPPGIQQIATAFKDANQETSFFAQKIQDLGAIISVGAVAKWASDVVQAGAGLVDMSEKTGISVEALQELDVIARQNGATMEDVGKAVFQMGKRIAGDNDSAANAIRELGLNFEDIRAMRPEDAFKTIGAAIGALPDTFKQAELGAAIFGRSVQNLIPVFDHIKESTGSFTQISNEQAQTLHDLDASWQRLSVSMILFKQVDDALHLTESKAAIDAWHGSVSEAPKVVDLWTESMTKRTAPAITDGLTHEKEIIAQLEAETKKLIAEEEELASAGDGWKGTLDGINGAVAEAVKWYLQAGVSQATLADQFGLTATQVKALASELKQETEDQKKANDGNAEAARLWADYNDKVDTGKTKLEAAQAKVDEYFTNLAIKMQAAGTDTAAFYAAWAADWDATRAALEKGEDELLAKYEAAEAQHVSLAEGNVKAFAASATATLGQVAAAAAATTAAVTAVWGAMASDPQRQYNKDPQDVSSKQDQANGVSTYNLGPGAQVALQNIEVTASNKASLIAQLQAIEQEYARFPGRAPGGTGLTGLNSNDYNGWTAMLEEQALYAALKKALPGYADGGPVMADGPIFAHAGEFVLSKEMRAGGSGGGDTTVNLMLDGSILASVVVDRLTGEMKQERLWPGR